MKLRQKKLNKSYATMLLAATVVTSGTVAPLVSKAAEYVAPPGAQS